MMRLIIALKDATMPREEADWRECRYWPLLHYRPLGHAFTGEGMR